MNLQKIFKEGGSVESSFDKNVNASRLMRLTDAFLLGTASERFEEHLSLFGSDFGEWQLQDCMYQIYEPEVAAISSTFLGLKNLDKNHKKLMQKFSKTYLLDKMELNVKARCVFSWSDPEFTGFKPLPDNHRIPALDLLRSRRIYFAEGTLLAGQLVKDYTTNRRVHYAEKKENAKTRRRGVYFILGTIIADWIVCTI